MRPLRLRSHLLLLTLGTLLPVVVFAAIAAWLLLVDLPPSSALDLTATVWLIGAGVAAATVSPCCSPRPSPARSPCRSTRSPPWRTRW